MNISHPKVASGPSTSSLYSRQPLICFLSLQISWHFLEFYINKTIQCALSFLSFTQHNFQIYSCCVSIVLSFLLPHCIRLCGCNTICIHSPVGRHLGCFLFLTITNRAAMNIPVQVYMDICFHFSWTVTWEQKDWDLEQICLKKMLGVPWWPRG